MLLWGEGFARDNGGLWALRQMDGCVGWHLVNSDVAMSISSLMEIDVRSVVRSWLHNDSAVVVVIEDLKKIDEIVLCGESLWRSLEDEERSRNGVFALSTRHTVLQDDVAQSRRCGNRCGELPRLGRHFPHWDNGESRLLLLAMFHVPIPLRLIKSSVNLS